MGTHTNARAQVGAYDEVPPITPTPREGSPGRPQLPAASTTKQHQPPEAAITNLQQASSEFTEGELSLLKEHAVTEITLRGGGCVRRSRQMAGSC